MDEIRTRDTVRSCRPRLSESFEDFWSICLPWSMVAAVFVIATNGSLGALLGWR